MFTHAASKVSIKLDATAKYLSTACDRLKGHTVANAGIDR